MMLRLIKSKLWISLILLFIFTLYLVSRWDKTVHTKRVKEQSQFQQTTFTAPKQDVKVEIKDVKIINEVYNRLEGSHLQVLMSALAHIRLGYVANRTPHYSTPPLLVLYSCHEKNTCGGFSKRLLDITKNYYFSMLQQGSAFAYDMTHPVKFEWFFEALPGFMSMNVDQANYYLERVKAPSEIKQETTFSKMDLVLRNFYKDYQTQGVTIVNVTEWKGDWTELKKNPSMKELRDKYRLNHFSQSSDWFWVASQLLFSQPTNEFRDILEPYKEILGGKIERASLSLSRFDPDNRKVTLDFNAKGWLRVGLRLNSEVNAECIRSHIEKICKETDNIQSCHVFLSTKTRKLFEKYRIELSQNDITVHAVEEKYGFVDLDQLPERSTNALFESDESKAKRDYSRVFMDWYILSKMDYLIGQEKDDFIKTAAWSAQVQTDLIGNKNNKQEQCHIIPMTDW